MGRSAFNGMDSASAAEMHGAGAVGSSPFENGPVGHIPNGPAFGGQYKRSKIQGKRERRSLHKSKHKRKFYQKLTENEDEEETPTKKHKVVVTRPDIIYHQAPEIVHRPPLIVHRPDIVIRRPSVIVHRPPVVVHRPAIVYHQPPVIFNTPGPIIHQAHHISHDMYVTHRVGQHVGSSVGQIGGVVSQPEPIAGPGRVFSRVGYAGSPEGYEGDVSRQGEVTGTADGTTEHRVVEETNDATGGHVFGSPPRLMTSVPAGYSTATGVTGAMGSYVGGYTGTGYVGSGNAAAGSVATYSSKFLF